MAADDDPAAFGRRLLRTQQRAALGTSLRGAPYVSLVLIVADFDASPLLLLSDLAQHSRNIAFDPRISLLLDGTAAYPDRLSGPRLTVIGQAKTVEDPRLLARFASQQPSSSAYSGFADFRLFRMIVERAHLVAGFGRIYWIQGRDLLFAADASGLAEAEVDILKHMNDDHKGALENYAQHLLGRTDTGWQMTGIDPEGIDMRCNGDAARLDFATPVLTPDAARAALIELAERARK